MENSALQKKLIQQVDKYDRDMEVITQVCSRSAQGVTLVCFIYSCADSLPLPTYLPTYLFTPPLPLFPVVCFVCSVQLSLSLFCMPFSTTELVHIGHCYHSDAGGCRKG